MELPSMEKKNIKSGTIRSKQITRGKMERFTQNCDGPGVLSSEYFSSSINKEINEKNIGDNGNMMASCTERMEMNRSAAIRKPLAYPWANISGESAVLTEVIANEKLKNKNFAIFVENSNSYRQGANTSLEDDARLFLNFVKKVQQREKPEMFGVPFRYYNGPGPRENHYLPGKRIRILSGYEASLSISANKFKELLMPINGFGPVAECQKRGLEEGHLDERCMGPLGKEKLKPVTAKRHVN